MVILFRGGLSSAERIVVKLGTNSVVDSHGRFDYKTINTLAQQIVDSRKKYIVVSSGAIRLGNAVLGWERSADLTYKQAAASVGQPLLMDAYKHVFDMYGIILGQGLLLPKDTPQHEANAKRTLELLLSKNILPIINENDMVSTQEITYGDNDLLAARIAKLLDADALILLTTEKGIYDSLETKRIIPYIKNPSEEKFPKKASDNGTGGISSKIRAANDAAGIPTIIANAREKDVLIKLFSGSNIGTILYREK